MQKGGESFAIRVAPEEEGVRLDHLLVHHLEGLSRSALLKSVRSGHVKVDDRFRKAGYRVRAGELISGKLPVPERTELVAENIGFPVIYEDEHILVLSKPPGLVVHPAAGHGRGTLVNALLHHCGSLPAMEDRRPGIVHRLDRDTSGIMLAAKTESAMRRLAGDFSNRLVGKVYHAILMRSPRENGGRIMAPIGRHPVRRKKMAVRQDGRYAATAWSVSERFGNGMCLMELNLETGRTHQIRVHMASIGCPVAGDELYGGRVTGPLAALVSRQLLHSSRLTFAHPESGRECTFSASLWQDMEAVLARLRRTDSTERT